MSSRCTVDQVVRLGRYPTDTHGQTHTVVDQRTTDLRHCSQAIAANRGSRLLPSERFAHPPDCAPCPMRPALCNDAMPCQVLDGLLFHEQMFGSGERNSHCFGDRRGRRYSYQL